MAKPHKHSHKKIYNRKRNFSKFVQVKICIIKKKCPLRNYIDPVRQIVVNIKKVK